MARQSDGDPFTAAVAPDSGAGDYTVSAGSLATTPTIDRTSGALVTVTLTAGASGAAVTGLRLRAQSVEVTNTTVVANRVSTTASRAQFGVRSYRLPLRAEIPVNDAQDFADAVVGFWADGRATASFALRGSQASARLTAALAREVGDRVRVVRGALDTEMHVEQIAHEVLSPNAHVAVISCEEASAASYFVIDTDELDGASVIGF